MRGDGRVFRRGRFYWVAYMSPSGVELRESSRSEKESDALKLLKRRMQEVANARSGIRAFEGPAQKRLTLRDLFTSLEAEYRRRNIKSLKSTLLHMKPVKEFFDDYRAIAVTTDLVRKYVEQQRAKGLSNATINRGLEQLSAAFSLALKEERLAHKPYIPKLPVRNARKGFFEHDEHEAMQAHLNVPMSDMAQFAYVSGWRKEEIRPLNWSQVDRNAQEVRLDDSKNSEGRVLPLDDDTWQMFERLWAARQFKTNDGNTALSEFVFHRGDGKPVSMSYFEELWDKARTAAKLPHRIFHDYRRTAVRNLIRAGVPQAVAMAITGHKTESMFRRYNITTTDDKLEAMKKVRAHLKKAHAGTASVVSLRAKDGGASE